MKEQGISRRSGEALLPEQVFVRAFARLDAVALGLAIGLVTGVSLFAATVFLFLKGGEPLGPHLALLSQYIPGYAVSWRGSLVGAVAGLTAGFAVGWTIAVLRNLTISIYMFASTLWVRLNRFLDDV